MDRQQLQNWFKKLAERDPVLHAELARRLRDRAGQPPTGLVKESAVEGAPWPFDIALETIVREGRPALFIHESRISLADASVDPCSVEMVGRLKAAAPVLEPLIPLVGRIEASNLPASSSYLATGWLIAPDIVVTNRHVAERLARWDGSVFNFYPGRFGETLVPRVSYRREHGREDVSHDSVPIVRVIWIERDPLGPDIAFLEVSQRGDGTRPNRIDLAEQDPDPATHVAAIGYPARASADAIPDQERMERIYGRVFEVKRIAPGQITDPSRGWTTHDCTTLGGNSGSVLLDMQHGKASGLHFAGLYEIENYAVPASRIRRYLCERPWHGQRPDPPCPAPSPERPADAAVRVAAPATGSMSITIPLVITVSLGPPVSASLDAATRMSGLKLGIDAAAAELFRDPACARFDLDTSSKTGGLWIGNVWLLPLNQPR